MPRSLCKYLYNIYHPCDVVSYRVEPIFMKFYSQVEPVHLKPPVAGATFQTSHIDDAPLQPLQNARKEEDQGGNEQEKCLGKYLENRRDSILIVQTSQFPSVGNLKIDTNNSM